MKHMKRIALYAIGLVLFLAAATRASALENGILDAAASAEFLGQTGDMVGLSIAGSGDVNGDGYDDILIGAPGRSSGAGAAYLIPGSPSGWSLAKSLGQAPALPFTGQANDGAGTSVAGAGDVNGDGLADFLVGAPLNDDGGFETGAVYLVLGSAAPAGGSLATAIQYTGDIEANQAGRTVAGAGDVNGDGYDDFLVGAFSEEFTAGVVYLVLGSAAPAGGSLAAAIRYDGNLGGDATGASLAGAGDVNGDGYADFLVGAPGDGNGYAYLVLGDALPGGGPLLEYIRYNGAPGDLAGTSVAGGGDVNGDGYADMLVGAPGSNSSAGVTYLILGSGLPGNDALLNHIGFQGEALSEAGTSVAGAGDMNGDGEDDVIIGAPGFRGFNSMAPDTGGAYIWQNAGIRFEGEAAGHLAGSSVAGAGDVNGDGYTDVLVGAPGNTVDGSGAVYLIFSDAPVSGVGPALTFPFPDGMVTVANLLVLADAATSVANAPFRHRARLAGSGDTLPIGFEQARLSVDFAANALSGADVAATRHVVHPCNSALRLQMPIWDVDSGKMGPTTTVDLRFQYTDGQLGEMVEADLKLYRRASDQPCSAWYEVVGSTVDVNTNTVAVSGLSDLGQFTIASATPNPTAIDTVSMATPAGQKLPGSLMSLIFMMVAGSGMALWRHRRHDD